MHGGAVSWVQQPRTARSESDLIMPLVSVSVLFNPDSGASG
jgi:hypothetical protein